MIIFAITTNVEFIEKPEWLDAFFNKHNKVKYDFHITLKQPCIIEKNDIKKVKNILSNYFKENSQRQIELIFDNLNSEASEEELSRNDACVLLESKNKEIEILQKDLVYNLSSFKKYLFNETKKYEDNFIPHITIADGLNKKEMEVAKKGLKDDYVCRANATKAILTVVYDFKEPTEKREEITYNLL